MIRKILTSSLITLVAVGGFFVNIEKQENQTTKTVSYELFSVTQVHAADFTGPCPSGTVNDGTSCVTESTKKWNDMIDYLNMGIGVITAIISPAIILASWLMSPDWTSGDVFGLRTNMHSLWVTISNILYFVYAVLLIVIALATMFNQEKFGYKVMLPKLALGIILVPFTWWFVQWTISLASVVTASVVTIPQGTINTNDKWYNTPIIPNDINVQTLGSENPKPCTPETCKTINQFTNLAGGQWSPLVTYAYGVFKFQHIDKLSSTTDVISAALQLVHNGLVGALMFLVFGILVIALIFILLMRAIKLWMYAIFSPLFTLHFVVGKEMLGKQGEHFTLKEFIGLAFVPAVIGLVLSFGLVIITGMHGLNGATSSSNDGKTLSLFGTTDNYIKSGTSEDGKTSVTTVVIGGVKWTFNGGTINAGETPAAQQLFGAIDNAGNTLGTIILDIIALVFIWAAFMAAKGVSTAVEAAVQPFEDMGKKIGALGMSLPKYAPILPPSMGGSMAGANRAIEIASQIPSKASEERLKNSELGKLLKMGEQASQHDMEKMRGLMTDKLSDVMRAGSHEASETLKIAVTNADKYGSEANIKMYGDKLKESLKDEKSIATYLKDSGMDEKYAKSIAEQIMKNTDPKSNNELAKAWKEVAKSGVTTPASGSAGSTIATIDGNKQNHIILSVGNITNQDTKVTVSQSANDIAKGISSNNSLKGQFSKESLKSTLSGVISDKKKIEEIINAINNDFFKE